MAEGRLIVTTPTEAIMAAVNPGEIYMSRVKQTSKRKRRSKVVPVLGAAGLSLSLASGASAATETPVVDVLTQNPGVGHEITLREEEIADVSLATFYVFNKERPKAYRVDERPPVLGQACCQFACLGGQSDTGTGSPSTPRNDTYSLQPRPIRPLHKNVRKRP
jgi:hypothetical protein